MSLLVVPSLLAADHGRLASEADRVARLGVPWVHLDVMDGHFVPNLSFGPGVVAALRPRSRLFFDVHLMCSRPEILIQPFAEAGANQLTVHAELGDRVSDLLWRIRSHGLKAGLAVNPPTTMIQVEPFLPQIDLLLVMTVNPGFGGQSFITECLPKIQQARIWRDQRQLSFRIQVDGGINRQTAADCARAGADTFVAGTALFGQSSLRAGHQRMLAAVEKAAGTDGPLFTRVGNGPSPGRRNVRRKSALPLQ